MSISSEPSVVVDKAEVELLDDDVVVGQRKRTQEDANITTDGDDESEEVTEEEVEAFCTIYARLRRHVKYFGAGINKRWRPSLAAEDLDVVREGGKEELGMGIQKAGGLDLNVEPPVTE